MIIRGDFVHCPRLGELLVLHDQVLGFIEHLGAAHTQESQEILNDASEPPIVLERGTFLVPTFCDLHLHAPQFLYQGTGLHLPLMEWLNEYAFKAEESLDADPILAERVYTRLTERLIENGTGAVLLFGTIKVDTNLILARVMQRAGIRAFVGKLSMDMSSRPTYVEPSVSGALSSVISFVSSCRGMVAHLPVHERLVEPVLTPRFVPTCSDALLRSLGELASAKNLRVQSHMAEAHDQVDYVRRERGKSDVEIFAQSRLLTPRTVQAHCTFLDSPSLVNVAKSGAAIAHCPLSNAYFSARPFRLREALNVGAKVGLGTDIAGGYDIDIMGCMRQAVTDRIIAVAEDRQGYDGGPLAIDWKEALYLATRGGAIALDLPTGTGAFAVGAPFDAQCIQLFDSKSSSGIGPLDFFEGPHPTQLTLDVIEKWWCLGDMRNRLAVWIQGKQLWGKKLGGSV
ncbi:uncharacterized protein B0H18DRAFT_1081974 [Fomitopsis serialis]|uniref:uncharacterized protein n=1 Tax=Fomitopsis serialis TaxID=139415 RepID=UPI0020074F6A|nr:uncharacterized protein B0H18DRAFT_1081974 [Neoantrodia serialis]KAH9936337.1 hypothetical protein B0H18DRAFT_1081974 [Neoantrodia serialis]